MEVVLEMSFLPLSNANVKFAELKMLTWRFYTTAEALPTTNEVKLIDKREFAKTALDENSKIFVIHISALEATKGMYSSQAIQIAALQWDKTLTKVPAKYFNSANVFSFDLVIELPENIRINEYVSKLIEGE